MSLRLRYGPHGGSTAGQVVMRDPQYCLWWLAERPESALANAFRELIDVFNKRGFCQPCAACTRPAAQSLATLGLSDCRLTAGLAPAAKALSPLHVSCAATRMRSAMWPKPAPVDTAS